MSALAALGALLAPSSARAVSGLGPITVEAPGVRARLGTAGLLVELPVLNSGNRRERVSVAVRLLAPNDRLMSKGEAVTLVSPGRRAVRVSLPLDSQDTAGEDSSSELLWARLRYELRSEAGDTPVRGTVSLPSACPDAFDLVTAHFDEEIAQRTYAVRVSTLNPVTRRPVPWVVVKGRLTFGDGDTLDGASCESRTGPSGDAVLRCPVPAEGAVDSGSFLLEARKGRLSIRRELAVSLARRRTALVTMDKPLYQPGQTLHARALARDERRHAISGRVVRFTLIDPAGEEVWRSEARTNEFGIASISQPLPDGRREGNYRLTLADVNGEREFETSAVVVVRRYELPTFTVTAAADRQYYLRGQEATVTVNAGYLFGKPVVSGRVRLVREAERRWDFTAQRWTVTEDGEQQARLDRSGQALFRVPLSRDHDDLADRDYARYRDLRLAAYVTDETTGKTEQRRLDIRLTRDPVHLYISGYRILGRQASFYVTASYPDGEPAALPVNVSVEMDSNAFVHARTVTTNRYGVARVDALPVPATSRRIRLETTTTDGGLARWVEWVWARDAALDVRASKSIHRPGEPILLTLRSPEDARVVLEVRHERELLWTGRAWTRRRGSSIVIPYLESFKGALDITAYTFDPLRLDDGDEYEGMQTIVYPHDTGLRVRVSPDRHSYGPGNEAVANIRVATAGGVRQQAALGVSVIDRAVEERARTDSEFEGSPWWDFDWVGGGSLGALSLADLLKLDLAADTPPGLDLAAEVLLNAWAYPRRPEVTDGYAGQRRKVFLESLRQSLAGVTTALEQSADAPVNQEELDALLLNGGIDRSTLRDAWDMPLDYSFRVDRANRIVAIASAGPDKIRQTGDDLTIVEQRWQYFAGTGKVIDAALSRHAAGSTQPCVGDEETLKRAVQAQGLALFDLRDPWGQPYQYSFDIKGAFCQVVVRSQGGTAGPGFPLWTSRLDYFAESRAKIVQALENGPFPTTEEELRRRLHEVGLPWGDLRDPRGRRLFATFSTTSEYGDDVEFDARTGMTVSSVTRQLQWIRVKAAGPDGLPWTVDDDELAAVSRPVSARSGADSETRRLSQDRRFGPGLGGLEGVVRDTSRSVIPGVRVGVSAVSGNTHYETETGGNGRFLLTNLPVGTYRVTFSLPGFRDVEVRDVPVTENSITKLDAELAIATLAESVQVTAEAPLVDTRQNAATAAERAVQESKGRQAIATPRLRSYFPETLFWAPSVITDSAGRARLQFTLADSITTWKMHVIASTKNGAIGTAELDLVAFQPFFVEHDPPKILTVGDRVELPVVVRNYLPERREVRVSMQRGGWYELERPGVEEKLVVEPDTPARVFFPFTVTAAAENGRQQVSASADGAGDRIERTVSTHPNGEERTTTVTGLLNRGGRTLRFAVPADALNGFVRATVKVYPNLLAHVVESVEAGLQRPHGCTEQTISSTYPSLLLLKAYGTSTEGRERERARRYLESGLTRVLARQAANGAFGYWDSKPDAAVTAYAVRFLLDASEFVPVDRDRISRALEWLVSQQDRDGEWSHAGESIGSHTAYVARALAMATRRVANTELKSRLEDAVARALERLSSAREPYAMAFAAIAAWDAGNQRQATQIATALQALARREGGLVYWAPESNTAFYGWGTAGRLETTAAVVSALELTCADEAWAKELIDLGLTYMLQRKDPTGIWLSGQATVGVLDALLSSIRPGVMRAALEGRLKVNGVAGPTFSVPPSTAPGSPVLLDVGPLVRPGENVLEISMPADAAEASAQVVVSAYVPWRADSSRREALLTGEQRALRAVVAFDKTHARVGESIVCRVELERIGNRGHGMLLAEVGLPPGMDVDRASLEALTADWSTLMGYEVRPDRVVLYSWPKAGGTRLSFRLSPRFPMSALSEPSTVYDYYNPDERVVVPPFRMTVEK